MGLDVTALAASKKYTEDTAVGLGAVKGAPCTVSGVTTVEGGTNITLKWTGTNGREETTTVFIKDGAKGDTGAKGDKGDKGDAGEVAISFIVADKLPTKGANGVMYLVPKAESGEYDIYNEYMYISNSWELIGTTDVNLTDYYTKTEVDGKVLDVYSTDETIVGTWVDGKPLYRKVIIESVTSEVSQTISIDSEDIEIPTIIYGGNYNPTSGVFLPYDYNESTQMYSRAAITRTSIVVTKSNKDYWVGNNWIFVIQYTKTTD